MSNRPVDLIFPERKIAILEFKCLPPPIGCGEFVAEFKDELSAKEYEISGLCQACQDAIFGSNNEG